jgi:catechol 2,3-dioxygenase-like lactoylglutathione lyase family enzyme
MQFFVDDLAATKARLAQLGYDGFEDVEVELVGRMVQATFLRDPDGAVVELIANELEASAPWHTLEAESGKGSAP